MSNPIVMSSVKQDIYQSIRGQIISEVSGARYVDRYHGQIDNEDYNWADWPNSCLINFPETDFAKQIGQATRPTMTVEIYICTVNYAEAFQTQGETSRTDASAYTDWEFEELIIKALNGFSGNGHGPLDIKGSLLVRQEKAYSVQKLTFQAHTCRI